MPLGVVAQGEGRAIGAGARGAADAMDIALGDVRKLVIDHMGHAVHIDAAGGDVGGDEHRGASGAEGLERPLALALALVAMDRDGGKADSGEIFGHLVSAALGAGEDDGALDLGPLQKLRQQLALAGRLHMEGLLPDALGGGGDRGHRNLHGIAQHVARKARDLLRHGGREEEVLTLARQLGDDLADRHHEAKIQHVIGLVQNADFRAVEAHIAGAHMVEQAAGGGDDHIEAARQNLTLRAQGHAADDAGDLQAGEAAIGAEALGDLRRQLTGRRQNQNAHEAGVRTARVGQQALDDGQREGRRLAGAGLGDAEQIAALQKRGDGLCLNGGGMGVAFFGQSAKKRLDEAEILELCQCVNFRYGP